MKIAYVTNYLPGMHSHAGGAEKAILDTAGLAAKRGNEVVFIALPADEKEHKPPPYPVYPLHTVETLLPFLRRAAEVLKWYLFQFDPVSYFSARRVFARLKPDIAHFGNFQFLSFSVLLAARHCGIPTVVSVYDYWYFCPLTTLYDRDDRICRSYHGVSCIRCLPDTMRPVQRLLLSFRRKYFDRMLRNIGRYIVLSESSFSILAEYGIARDRIGVVRLPALETYTGHEKRKYILFIGWLQKRKGLHVLLDALPLIWKTVPEAQLKAVVQNVKWEEEYAVSIRRRLQGLPRDKILLDSGRRDRAEIKRLIAEAAVVVVPEQWENMSPLLVMEAMLAGTPVVASRIGGIPEFIRDGIEGLLAAPDNPAEFAGKIVSLLRDEKAAAAFGGRAVTRARELLDPEALSDRLIKEYSLCATR